MSTQIERRRELTPAQKTKALLDSRTEEFGRALAGRVDPAAFVRVAYATITKSPKLLEATPASLIMALLEAASLGLTPNGVLGEAYIVPFNNKVKGPQGDRWEVQAQFIPGYRGLIKLARQSGVIKNIVARIVYKGDHFALRYGLDETLEHVPNLDADQSDRNITHVYAVAHFRDGTTQFEVMTVRQVDAIRARSKSKDHGPWVTDYPAMTIKTVIRRLVKYLPLSDFDLASAIEADDRVIGAADIESFSIAPVASRAAQVLEKVQTRELPSPQEIAVVDEAVDDEASEGEGTGAEEVTGEASATASEDKFDTPDPTANDGPVLDEFEFLFETLEIVDGDANTRQRNELRKVGDEIYGPDSRGAKTVRALADEPALGRAQIVQFLSAGKAVLAERAKKSAATTPTPADPFGEGED